MPVSDVNHAIQRVVPSDLFHAEPVKATQIRPVIFHPNFLDDENQDRYLGTAVFILYSYGVLVLVPGTCTCTVPVTNFNTIY